MSERVSITVSDGVADVRLTRADKMNALDPAMFKGLIEAGDELAERKDVRAIVLSGEGRAFCAGLDMGNFQAMAAGARKPVSAGSGEGRLGKRTRGIANDPQWAVWQWREMPVPVIAAVHGVAFGGGFQLMLGADMRYIAPDAKLSILEIKWGLVPDMAGTQLLRHLMREDLIRELSYTGRVFLGEEAGALGLATRVVADPREAALATAKEIAGKNPDAIRAAKRIFNAAPYVSAADGLMAESREQDALAGSPNQVEAVMASLEKRAAKFR